MLGSRIGSAAPRRSRSASACCLPRTRRPAALGLIALLVIVFPANIDMAVNRVEVKPVDGRMTRSVGTATGPLNWIRLPLQLPVAWWLWREANAARTVSS